MLEREVFPQPEFALLAREAVLLRVDVEDGGAGSELAARYDAYSLPTMLLLEPSGALAGKVAGYAPAREYVAPACARRSPCASGRSSSTARRSPRATSRR